MARVRTRGTPLRLTLALLACACASTALAGEPGAFWESPKRGANFFNQVETRERFRAAREAGLEWVRLVPDKWTGARGPFLLGDAGDFRGIVPEDLSHLQEVLGWAEAEGMPVVVGMLNLPGCRWVQQNDGKQDYRLWNEERYQEQAATFWRQLASKLKDHPVVVAYNPLNEPHPAREAGLDDPLDPAFTTWLEAHEDTTGDLDRFYERIVHAVREVDPRTPILIEGYAHGSAGGLTHLSPVDDSAILYSFHFYEPWQYTARKANKDRYSYPDAMPASWDGPAEKWDRDRVARMMDPVSEWARAHGVPASRIVAAEFGCDRGAAGAREYLEDVVSALNTHGWHWAFYSFREDAWDRMDYEVGTGGLGAAYWEAVERGENPDRPWKDNPLWRVLRDGLRAGR
jgi:endoglucanase